MTTTGDTASRAAGTPSSEEADAFTNRNQDHEATTESEMVRRGKRAFWRALIASARVEMPKPWCRNCRATARRRNLAAGDRVGAS
jgi:hypothetical protein